MKSGFLSSYLKEEKNELGKFLIKDIILRKQLILLTYESVIYETMVNISQIRCDFVGDEKSFHELENNVEIKNLAVTRIEGIYEEINEAEENINTLCSNSPSNAYNDAKIEQINFLQSFYESFFSKCENTLEIFDEYFQELTQNLRQVKNLGGNGSYETMIKNRSFIIDDAKKQLMQTLTKLDPNTKKHVQH